MSNNFELSENNEASDGSLCTSNSFSFNEIDGVNTNHNSTNNKKSSNERMKKIKKFFKSRRRIFALATSILLIALWTSIGIFFLIKHPNYGYTASSEKLCEPSHCYLIDMRDFTINENFKGDIDTSFNYMTLMIRKLKYYNVHQIMLKNFMLHSEISDLLLKRFIKFTKVAYSLGIKINLILSPGHLGYKNNLIKTENYIAFYILEEQIEREDFKDFLLNKRCYQEINIDKQRLYNIFTECEGVLLKTEDQQFMDNVEYIYLFDKLDLANHYPFVLWYDFKRLRYSIEEKIYETSLKLNSEFEESDKINVLVDKEYTFIMEVSNFIQIHILNTNFRIVLSDFIDLEDTSAKDVYELDNYKQLFYLLSSRFDD